MRLFLLLLVVSSAFALKCLEGSDSYITTTQSKKMVEKNCGRNQVCGTAPHMRGVIKMCISENVCKTKSYRVMNSYASLYCCGDKDLCNGATTTGTLLVTGAASFLFLF